MQTFKIKGSDVILMAYQFLQDSIENLKKVDWENLSAEQADTLIAYLNKNLVISQNLTNYSLNHRQYFMGLRLELEKRFKNAPPV